MNFKLEIWRQFESGEDGAFEKFEVTGIDPEASFLEMLDQLNERLGQEKKRSIAFDSDCREGICGSCSLVIDGHPHGPRQVTSCQTYMRDFIDGATIKVEPFRASTMPVIRDLVTDRSALDRVIRSGRYWVPHWYKASHWIAYWDMFDRPAQGKPKYARGIPETWWYDPARAAKLERRS